MIFFYEDNVQVEQPLGESGSRNNIGLVGGSLSDQTLDWWTFELFLCFFLKKLRIYILYYMNLCLIGCGLC